jgi:predicted RNA-binding Zn ribbon-like protein
LAGHRAGIHHGHRDTAGCQAHPETFQDVCERARFGRDWAPRDLRHTFVSLLSDDGMAIEKIARLAGQASSHVTETVYRQELRPVLRESAEVMDRLFDSVNGGSAARMTRRTATEHAASKSAAGRSRTHAGGVRRGMLTAPNRTWQRPAAPVLLPESDTAGSAVAVGAGPHSEKLRQFQV